MQAPMQAPGTRRRRLAVRRLTRRLITAACALALAAVPTGIAQAGPAPAEVFAESISVTPQQTTLAQFSKFTVSGFGFALEQGTVLTVRLRGFTAGTITTDSTGGFAPQDFPVPAGAATCSTDSPDTVTLDDGSANPPSTTVSVFCPTLAATPDPVFSAGLPTNLAFTLTGFVPNATVAMTLDGQSLLPSVSVHTDAAGAASGSITGVAPACGPPHQLTATFVPPVIPSPRVQSEPLRTAAAAATTTYPQPAVSTAVTVLGCATSSPPPQIFADPVETGIDQFTRFSVDGFDLAAGPATIRLRGAAAGTVVVAADGTFPSTDFAVPAGAAACGTDAVSIDDVAASVAQTGITVFCPKLAVAPDPVFSGGAPADLSITGTGYPGGRPVDFTVDGRGVGTATSGRDGSVALAVPGIALPCGAHQVVGTAQPPQSTIGAGPAAVRATVAPDPPIPASAPVTVLGCPDSTPPPLIDATPVETTLGQFTRFTVDGSQLPAGPGTIRLGGVAAGTVQVGPAGTFPSTDLAVPAGAAACGQDPVTIDDGGPVLATAVISVFCPVLAADPNPVDSGGAPTTLTLTGTGYPANRPVDLGLDGQTRTTVTSDATGAIHAAITGVSPACGEHQATATAHPPASAAGASSGAAAAAFAPVSAFTTVTVVGCARIVADPAVVQQGMLTHVTGSGFLPRTALTLTWQGLDGSAVFACSPDTVQVPALVTDAAGGIDVFCLAFAYQAVGALRIAAAQPPELETTPVVIEDGPMQPSNDTNQFVFRR